MRIRDKMSVMKFNETSFVSSEALSSSSELLSSKVYAASRIVASV